MKNRVLNKFIKLALLALMAAMVIVSCKKDDETTTPPVVILDGYYVQGAGTALTALDAKGLMKVTKNEVTNLDRPDLLELYIAVKAGTDGFNIVMVSGSTTKTYGPGADFALIDPANLDVEEPQAGLWKGTLAETTDKFTVPTDGLYHLAIDKELMKVVMAKVEWGVIGGATPGGWGGSTPLPQVGAFDLNSMKFEIAEITMLANEWKFRYSNGWKIIIDATYDNGTTTAGLKVNTNFGGAVNALVPGGGNIVNDTYAVYKITMNWSLSGGTTAAFVYVKDAEPLPTYPDTMYIVGAGTAYGWDAPGTHADAAMHKCAGGAPSEGIYWKICYLEAGQGFKVSDAGWGSFNYGFAEIDEFDANGVAVTDNGGNMDIAASGMYIVVLNLRDNMKKLSVKAAEVYGMGDAFGGWDEDKPANLFTIDNVAKTLVAPALSVDGNIRMYAQHEWIPAWWNAEFNLYSGVIEYRNDGGDQAAVPGTAGQVITLHFDDNTGTIQ
jgi:hypothetical protein